MDINSIRRIVNESSLSDDLIEQVIIDIISRDEKIIPILLGMLNSERQRNKELLLETNAELSKALICLEDNSFKKDNVIKSIKEYYLKWKDFIKCCFKVEGLP